MTSGQKTILLGCGTGRCGTQSLSRLVDGCEDARCTHELRPLLPWRVDEELLEQRLRQFARADTSLVGDVAYYYLPYLDRLLTELPPARVICLRRDRDEVVDSFMKWTRWRNHWYDHDGSEWVKDHVWDATHPKFDLPDKREALGAYWDHYYDEIGRLGRAHSGRVLVMDLADINTRDGQERVLDFLEVPAENRRYPEGEPRHNVGAAAERATSMPEAADWMRRALRTAEEIRALIAPTETLILADEEQLRDWIIAGRRALHFTELHDEYNGPPADAAAAIVELERMRRAGARFMVFAWPAFWWLDHYAGLLAHLRATARCVLDNERVVVFELPA